MRVVGGLAVREEAGAAEVGKGKGTGNRGWFARGRMGRGNATWNGGREGEIGEEEIVTDGVRS